ncbi:hypothetical protein ABSA28_00184 [Candidatus Hepatincolaceae symbiont of Richtersius coronifer]
MKSKKPFRKYEKDLLEEILERNRKRLASLSNAQDKNRKTRRSTFRAKSYSERPSRKNLSTVFKSIDYRKTYDSLGIVMRYMLKILEL